VQSLPRILLSLHQQLNL